MIGLWLAGWCLAAEPTALPNDPAVPPRSAPVEGRLGGKDARDALGLPYDGYTFEAPPGVWVEARVRDYAFPLRVRVGDEGVEFPAWFADDAVVHAWSGEGGPVVVEVGTTDKGGVGPYALSVALVSPATTEPPTVDKLPPHVVVEPTDWVDDGWFCDLVTARFDAPTTLTVTATTEDAARTRLLVGRWDSGLHVDARGEAGARRSGPLELPFEAGVPRVFGACRDRLGTAYLEVRTPDAHIAPGTVIDPSRRQATLAEAASAVQADLEGRMSTVLSEVGKANRHEPLVVPLFLQSGLDYEMVALTEDDALIPFARLYLAYCDATCEAFAAAAGMQIVMDGSWYTVALPDEAETQAFMPPHTERWRLTWPEGTSLTATLQVYVGAVAAQGVRVVVGEE